LLGKTWPIGLYGRREVLLFQIGPEKGSTGKENNGLNCEIRAKVKVYKKRIIQHGNTKGQGLRNFILIEKIKGVIAL